MDVYINARFLTQTITGVQQFAWEICRNLSSEKISFTLLAPKGVHQPPELKHLGFRNVGKLSGYTWEQIELPAFLSKNGKKLLLNFCNSAPLIYKNQFVTIHDLSFIHHPEWYSKSFARVYNFLIPKIATRSKHILTVSHHIKAELENVLKITPNKISVLYNGIGSAVRQAGPLTPKEKIILSVSSINPRKNLAGLIEAFELSGLSATYKLLIVGAENNVFAKNKKARPFNPQVQFLGYVNNEQLMQLYDRAELFASFSFDEGFGIPVLEALSFGCKLALSDIPAYKELFAGVASFAEPSNVKSCAEILKIAISQPAADKTNAKHLFTKYDYAQSSSTLAKLVEENF